MSSIKNLFLFSEDEKASFYYGIKEKTGFLLKKSDSTDGYVFKTSKTKVEFKNKARKKESIEKIQDLKTTKQGKKYFLTYNKKEGGALKSFIATSSNLTSWTTQGGINGIKNAGAIVPDFSYDKDKVMYIGGKSIKIAYSKDMLSWKEDNSILMKPKVGKFDADEMVPAQAFVRQEGIVLIYYAFDKTKKLSIGIALFNKDNPEELLWRSPRPIWKQKTRNKINPLGLVGLHDRLFFFYEDKDGNLISVALPVVWYPQAKALMEERPVLMKSFKNPIFGPKEDNHWENFAAFNPTAFKYKDKIYLLYRALGNDNLSVVGCAVTTDGVHIDERCPNPIYVPTADFEGGNGYVDKSKPKSELVSGGGWGGCEDPKVTLIGDTLYMVYVAFNGWSEPNIAFTSIKMKDFLAKNWKAWRKPVKITSSELHTKNPKTIKESLADRPTNHIGSKNPAILPEKINGKYVVFHRIWPNIVFDYVDDLNFDGKTFLPADHILPIRKEMWDGKKIGMGCAPLKIKEGWLVIYNAVSAGKYKIGAMILDAKNPAKVLYRSPGPIIEPTEHYENYGHKYGVVFAGGSAIKDGKLFIYYGGSDKYSCVAVADLKGFIEKLKNDSTPRINKVKITA